MHDIQEVLDDWEDDLYLDRIESIEIREFNPINENYIENDDDEVGVSGVEVAAGGVGNPLVSHQGYVDSGDMTDIDKHTFKVN